ncbi:hypothetical protein BGZ63DRAFT_409329 [Mariannaea sp. PMI_226]|nr:hypothetical protein BGZ63DRAFT_409329 [Mariannaea sp. PMI_226]
MADASIYPFVHLPQYSIIICQICQFACLSHEVPRHLQQRHGNIEIAERQRVGQRVLGIPELLRNVDDLGKLAIPPPSKEPIQFLAPPRSDGLQCRKCHYISRHVQKMQEHCRETHNWQNPRSAGRPLSGTETTVELPWRDGIYCQRFFPSRAGSRWFEVGQKAKASRKQPGITRSSIATLSGLPDKPPSLTPEAYAHVKAVMEREERYHQVENQPRNSSRVLGQQSFTSTSLWLERTRWHLTFQDSRRDILRALTQLPNRRSLDTDVFIGQGYKDGDPDIVSASISEQKIACILGAMDPVLDRCEQTVHHTCRSLLCWLRSNQMNSCHNKEFALVAEESSRQWYRTLWKRFLAFVLRVCRMDKRLQLETNLTARVRTFTFFESIWQHRVWNFVDTSKGVRPNSAACGERTADAAIDQGDDAYWVADEGFERSEREVYPGHLLIEEYGL